MYLGDIVDCVVITVYGVETARGEDDDGGAGAGAGAGVGGGCGVDDDGGGGGDDIGGGIPIVIKRHEKNYKFSGRSIYSIL